MLQMAEIWRRLADEEDQATKLRQQEDKRE
jgi:hypothetical protein